MQRRPHSTPANFGMGAGQAEMHAQSMAPPAPSVQQQGHFHASASMQNRQPSNTPTGTQMQRISTSMSENYPNTSFNLEHSSSMNNLSLQNSPSSSSYSLFDDSSPLTAFSVQNATASTTYSLQNSSPLKSYSLQNSSPSTAFSLHNASPSTSFSLLNSSPSAYSLHKSSSSSPAAYDRHNSLSSIASSLQNSSPSTTLCPQNSSSPTATGSHNYSAITKPYSVYQSTSPMLTSSITQSTSSTSPSLAKTLSSPALNELLKTSSPKSKQTQQLPEEASIEEDSADLTKALVASEYDLIEEYISQDLQGDVPDSNVAGHDDRNQNNAEDKLCEEFSSPNLKTVVDLEYSSYSHSIKSISDDELSRIYDDCPFLPEIKNVSIELVATSKYIDALVLLRAEHDRLKSILTLPGDSAFLDAVLMMKDIMAQHHRLFPVISQRHDLFPSSDQPAPSPLTERVASLKPDDGDGPEPNSSETGTARLASQDQGFTLTNTHLALQAADTNASASHHQGDGSNNCPNVSPRKNVKAETLISRHNLDQPIDRPSEVSTELQNNNAPSAEVQYNTGSSAELSFNAKNSEELNYNNKASKELNYNTEPSTELNYNTEPSTELNFNNATATEALYRNHSLTELQYYNNGPPAKLNYNNGPPAEVNYNNGLQSKLNYNNGPSQEVNFKNGPPAEVNYKNGPPAKLNYNNGPPGEVNYNNDASTELHYNSGYQQTVQGQQRQSYSQVKIPTLGTNPPRLRLKNSPNGPIKTENSPNFLNSSCSQGAQDLRLRLPSGGNRQNTHQGGPSHNPKRFCTMNDAQRFQSQQMQTFKYMSIPSQNSYGQCSEPNLHNSHSMNYNALTSPGNTSHSSLSMSATPEAMYGESTRQFSQHRNQDYEFTVTSDTLPSQYYEQEKSRFQFPNR